jgi:predicted Rossmann fold nucleotide-binding protein DprA/Smf involved in DNA uptake
MGAALEAGGPVIGVLAENLLKKSVARDARPALADGRLLLLSPYHPEARFTVGTAMGRNKLIYAMADYGLVVSTAAGSGGTWAGATEELKREVSRPVFVRTAAGAPSGNRKLLEFGAVAFPAFEHDDDPRALLGVGDASRPRTGESGGNLFEYARKQADPPDAVRESPPATVYDAVLPILLGALEDATSADDLAERLEVGKTQLQTWLRRAVEEGAIRKLTRPVRYIRRA